MKKITVLGGGTGTFVVLSGLKGHRHDLSAIVTMMDSGGSTGRLRDQLGVLPPGDLRQCLVALSEASQLWRKLFLYRFETGDLEGHNFGNIFLSALEKVSSNYDEVIETASYVLKAKGHVIPVTFEKTNVYVRYESGKTIKGETYIDEGNLERSRIVEASLDPPVKPNAKAIKRLSESDYIILGPGDLYTSIIPVLSVSDIKNVISTTKSKIVYIVNLVTKTGQTTNYTASDHVSDISRYLGRQPDIVIINNGEVPQDVLQWYQSHDEKLVEDDMKEIDYNGVVIRKDLVNRSGFKKSTSDKLTRSILRHDSKKLAKVLLNSINH